MRLELERLEFEVNEWFRVYTKGDPVWDLYMGLGSPPIYGNCHENQIGLSGSEECVGTGSENVV